MRLKSVDIYSLVWAKSASDFWPLFGVNYIARIGHSVIKKQHHCSLLRCFGCRAENVWQPRTQYILALMDPPYVGFFNSTSQTCRGLKVHPSNAKFAFEAITIYHKSVLLASREVILRNARSASQSSQGIGPILSVNKDGSSFASGRRKKKKGFFYM